jgi:hypothetical protein
VSSLLFFLLFSLVSVFTAAVLLKLDICYCRIITIALWDKYNFLLQAKSKAEIDTMEGGVPLFYSLN